MAGIYLHIPFCKQACSYCDFYFITSLEYREKFVGKLIDEIKSYRGSPYTEHTFETIYLGGGTPSVLSASQIDRILQTVGNTFEVEPREITMEMNPDNVSADYLNALLDTGVQRASMGVQSFQPDLLEFMHRAHDREEALRCFELLAKTGFPSYSVDLIYGNPGQSLEQLDHDLELLTEFNPPHVSAYALTIESNTRLGKQHELGRLDPLPDEKVVEHFDLVIERLEKAGIYQYEVSNFSKQGCEARHNAGYWTHKNYLGMGPSAHSFWWDQRYERAMRWMNKPDIKSYLSGNMATAPDYYHVLTEGSTVRQKYREKGNSATHVSTREWEILNLGELAEERIMMGLRTRDGISQKELKQTYNYPLNQRQQSYVEKKKQEGLIRSVEPIQLSKKGLKLADAIILDLVSMKES